MPLNSSETSNFSEEREFCFPLFYKFISNSFTAPKRCEFFQKFRTTALGDCVVQKEEIADGIFVAETISKPKNDFILVKILNTREEDVTINNFQPNIQPLDNFDFCF
jgi:hypothetical protein